MSTSYKEQYKEISYITEYDLREIDKWVEKLEAIQNSGNLSVPSIPPVIAQAMKLANDPKSTLAEIEELIKKDQAISGKLVQISNSPLFRGVQDVNSIAGAITRLGQSELRMILFSAFVQTRMFRSTKYDTLFAKLLSHSLACASLSSYIAGQLNLDVETAYLAGFLHDVGMSALLFTIVESAEENELPQTKIAELTIRCLHEKAGRIVCEKWNMPEAVVEAVAYHHSFLHSENHTEMAALIQTADVLSYKMGIGFSVQELDSYRKPINRYMPLQYSFQKATNLTFDNYPTFEYFAIEKEDLLADIQKNKANLIKQMDAPWTDMKKQGVKPTGEMKSVKTIAEEKNSYAPWIIAGFLLLLAVSIFGWLYIGH